MKFIEVKFSYKFQFIMLVYYKDTKWNIELILNTKSPLTLIPVYFYILFTENPASF